MAQAAVAPTRVETYERDRAGVPLSADRPWWRRLVHPIVPVTAAVIAVDVFCLAWMYRVMTQKTVQDDGTVIPGYNNDAIALAAEYAFPTLAVLSALFILADRYRPQRLFYWLLAVTWGASSACGIALFLNEWTSAHLAVMWWEPGYDSARLAVFIAPFVEEAAKAVILFVIALTDRGRISSRLSGIALAGLTAVGFAFTENIIYYGQVIVYGSYTASAGDVRQWLREFALQRGLYFCFGHPLFTSMTGIGLAIACRHRSKVVRVVAPLAGYLTAAFLHMTFNTVVTAELVPSDYLNVIYIAVLLPLVALLVGVILVTLRRQRRLIADRLTDYVVMGWLPATYPGLFSRWWTRTKALLISPWHGNVVSTIRLQSAVTELAYLRDAVARGTVDQGGLWREHELIGRIRRLRSQRAIENPKGLRPYFWRRRAKKIGLTGSWGPPANAAAGQLTGPTAQAIPSGGPLRYSAVDPRWGPPS
ncbi:MAG: PrsW family intramembrane metalloprotease [Propionibacteriaceae bacterium]|jgi:RsiW-degrading membrane proteinase PrsW (M82 family)|nr:PrsW family intramembrane metalloprotease [Propionibacteriaceae bacterium]